MLALVQHCGHGNASPSEEAEDAVKALLDALAIGDHPLDQEAIRPRDEEGYVEGYDWRVPGALEQAFEAWRPYMPRDVAKAGLAGLAAIVAKACGEAGPRTEDAPSKDRLPLVHFLSMPNLQPPFGGVGVIHDQTEDGAVTLDFETRGLGPSFG